MLFVRRVETGLFIIQSVACVVRRRGFGVEYSGSHSFESDSCAELRLMESLGQIVQSAPGCPEDHMCKQVPKFVAQILD